MVNSGVKQRQSGVQGVESGLGALQWLWLGIVETKQRKTQDHKPARGGREMLQ
jgi:hypothetical protein